MTWKVKKWIILSGECSPGSKDYFSVMFMQTFLFKREDLTPSIYNFLTLSLLIPASNLPFLYNEIKCKSLKITSLLYRREDHWWFNLCVIPCRTWFLLPGGFGSLPAAGYEVCVLPYRHTPQFPPGFQTSEGGSGKYRDSFAICSMSVLLRSKSNLDFALGYITVYNVKILFSCLFMLCVCVC